MELPNIAMPCTDIIECETFISTFFSIDMVLCSAVICLRGLLHLARVQKIQRMSNNYQSHPVHPHSLCCSCPTSPPNPHIGSAKWPPELRAALQCVQHSHLTGLNAQHLTVSHSYAQKQPSYVTEISKKSYSDARSLVSRP